MPTLLLALPLPLFVALGVWQLERAEEKRDLTKTLEARAALEPAALAAHPVTNPEELRYRKVSVTGHWDTEHQIFIEGRHHAGQTGFHLITPLIQEGADTRVLVNRGWIKGGSDGSLPAVKTRSELVTVIGEADIPSPPAIVLHGDDSAALQWGQRWPYLTLPLFQATIDEPLQPLIVLADADGDSQFVRHWTRPIPNVWMHQGYAAQWFGFALIALVTYLRLSIEREPRVPKEQL